ncbi:MAG: YqjF family protein [Microbacteriaceae bacterium]
MTDAAAEPISPIAPPLAGTSTSGQRWSNLVFLHWRVSSDQVAPLLPPGLRPDEWDGSSWVGLIPFVLDRATIFGSPPVPYFGEFVEVNVRLYAVDRAGRRGVVFVSLEASRLAAVIAARAVFSIPYVWASTRLVESENTFRYTSTRHLRAGVGCDIRASRTADAVIDDPLADFLTARWGLFTKRGRHTLFLPNEHAPWEVFRAHVESLDDTLLKAAGFGDLDARAPDSVLFSPGVTTRFGSPLRVFTS